MIIIAKNMLKWDPNFGLIMAEIRLNLGYKC